jgi:hypothetical protein
VENNQKAQKDAPPQFNWVTERSACSLPKVFYALRQQVEEDVKTRNSLRPELAPYEFSVVEDINEFKVVLTELKAVLTANEVRESVLFCLTDYAIIVRDAKGNPVLEITSTFNDEGKCRLYVNAEPREFWQVRRMALEGLMFRGN